MYNFMFVEQVFEIVTGLEYPDAVEEYTMEEILDIISTKMRGNNND